jgi:hypothetical protein
LPLLLLKKRVTSFHPRCFNSGAQPLAIWSSVNPHLSVEQAQQIRPRSVFKRINVHHPAASAAVFVDVHFTSSPAETAMMMMIDCSIFLTNTDPSCRAKVKNWSGSLLMML